MWDNPGLKWSCTANISGLNGKFNCLRELERSILSWLWEKVDSHLIYKTWSCFCSCMSMRPSFYQAISQPPFYLATHPRTLSPLLDLFLLRDTVSLERTLAFQSVTLCNKDRAHQNWTILQLILYRTFQQVLTYLQVLKVVLTVLQAVNGVAKLKITAGFSREESWVVTVFQFVHRLAEFSNTIENLHFLRSKWGRTFFLKLHHKLCCIQYFHELVLK